MTDGSAAGRDGRARAHVVVLAAGLGSRLGTGAPKALTTLRDGRTILRQQLDVLSRHAVVEPAVVVVGFRADEVRAAEPAVRAVPNDRYASTNTARSLAIGLDACPPGDVLWLNGDVVCHPEVVGRVLAARTTAVAVDTAAVGEEEVKYDLDDEGWVRHLSKQVTPALGEAVGVNLVAAADRAVLRRRLDDVADGDYFERALELAIARDGLRVRPVDVSDLFAVEVDFPADLRRADDALAAASTPTP
ncbi:MULTISPECIES: phosphocholine cytidylyltransferase family protein [Cellulomonas]|uniref:4-diphosphocytidyl-2C-methyl-D-erythritol synthase n=1 Tax=Cellulomonas gilvus (strain ATCC 13127 / NRRL B-14078) TaxID=593907 RepID=F8A167_CELGA|nr:MULTISPECIES: NTP transferase domain-containing protein [Cellulomonas]AEI11614.1 4-diphosphocytidyl-2C-methyl-D-erythritol synthase [Cellulomonas gilvus ATCC 13127]MCR6690532.1 NTP transferase domain-containing protein [Cellulomonas sp.]